MVGRGKRGGDVEEAVQLEEIIAKLREADVLLSHGTEAGDEFEPRQMDAHQKTYQQACCSAGTPES